MVSVFLKCSCGYERTMDHGPHPDEALALPLYSQEYKVCSNCCEVKSVQRPIAENIKAAIEEKEALSLDPDGSSEHFFSGEAEEMTVAELKELLASAAARPQCPDCAFDELEDVAYGDDYTIACPRCHEQMMVRDLIASD